MPIYKKKPVTIEARQTPTDENEYQEAIKDIVEWVFEVDKSVLMTRNTDGHLVIMTLEGPMTVTPGWWVIKSVKGEFYPCKPDIFEMTYDFIGPKGYDAPYMVN